MSAAWHLPADPDCPDVEEYREGLFGDPMGRAMGAPLGEIYAAWERRHLAECERCREFACENIDVAA